MHAHLNDKWNWFEFERKYVTRQIQLISKIIDLTTIRIYNFIRIVIYFININHKTTKSILKNENRILTNFTI